MSAPLTLADRVAETAVNVTNVSPMPLGGAVDARHGSFVGALGVTGALVPYVIVHRTSGQWEYGYGVLATGPDTITRAVVKRNSAHTTSLINFSAGTVDVFLDIGAEDLPVLDADDRGITFVDYNAAPSFEHTLFGARGTKAAPTAIQSGDTLGRYGFGGYGATAFSNRARASARGSAAENWSDTAQGADLIFATTPKTTIVPADRVWISSEGAVSIGAVYGFNSTTSPLQVAAVSVAIGLFSRFGADGNSAGVTFIKSRGTTTGSLASVVATDGLFVLSAQGVAGDNATISTAAQLQVIVPTSGVASGTVAGQVNFNTRNLAGSFATRLILTSEGVLEGGADNTYALGTSAVRWSDFQSNTGSFSGVLSVGSQPGQYGASTQLLQVNALSVATARWSRSGADTSGVSLTTVKSRGAAIGTSAKVVAGDTLFQVSVNGIADDNSTVANAGQYRVDVPTGGVPGSGTTVSGDHVWKTTNIAGTSADRMWFGSEGVLSVGALYGQFSATVQPLQVHGTSATAYFSRSSADAGGARLHFMKSRGASIGTKTKVQAGDLIAEISSIAVADDNSTISLAADYYTVVPTGGVPGSGTTVSADHVWSTRNIAGTFADRMWLSSEGALAIGAQYGQFGAAAQILQVWNTGSIMFAGRSSNDTSGANVTLLKSRGTTAGSKAAVAAGDTISILNFGAIAGDNSTVASAAQIIVLVPTSGVATTTVAAQYNFATTNLAGSFAARVQLSSEGIFSAAADNTYALGTASLRWSDFQAVTGTFGGLVTFNATGNAWVVSAALARTAMTSTTGTNASYHGMTNTGGSGYVGLESSVGGGIFTGSSAYSLVLYTSSTQDIQLIRGGVLGLTVGSGGAVTVSPGAANSFVVGNVTLTALSESVALSSTGSAVAAVQLFKNNANGAIISFVKSRGATLGSKVSINVSDDILSLVGYAISSDNSTVAFGGDATLTATAVGATTIGAKWRISTVNNSGSYATRLLIDHDGSVQMSKYGVGAATFDASGNITSVSDERHKTDITMFIRGLRDLRGIRPITHRYNEASGLEMEHYYTGFSAQNVRERIPEAVFEDKSGILSFSDRPVLAAVMNGLLELEDRVATLEARN